MSKLKMLNGKVIFILVIFAFVAVLIPLGIQPFAANIDNNAANEVIATDVNPTIDPAIDSSGNPTVDPAVNPTVDPAVDPAIDPVVDPTPKNVTHNVYWKWNSANGTVIGQGTDADEKYFEVQDGDYLDTKVFDGVGYISYKGNLIAKAYPNAWAICVGFELKPHEKASSNEQFGPINEDKDLEVFFVEVENPNYGVLQGWVRDQKFNPIEGVEVYFTIAGSSDTPYYTKTDENGFYMIRLVKFGTTGSLNGYKKGYVAEYSQEFTIDEDYWYDFQSVVMAVGVYADVSSLIPSTDLHIKKYYSTSGTYMPVKTLAEEGTLHEVKGRQLPIGAKLYVLTKEECETLGYRYGTLYYKYDYSPGLGSIAYEIYVEPSTDLDVVYWGYSNDKAKDVVLQPGKANAIKIEDGLGTYKFYMAQDTLYTCPLDETAEGHSSYSLSYYQNGRLTYGPYDQHEFVALYENGITWVDLFGVLHCTLDDSRSNDHNTYEMVLKANGDASHEIYEFNGLCEDGQWHKLTTEPTDEKLQELVPEYLASGNMNLNMVEGVDHYQYSLDIDGEPAIESEDVNQNFEFKLFAGTEFNVLADGSLEFNFENYDGYNQLGNINCKTADGYESHGWSVNGHHIDNGFKVDQGGTYVIQADFSGNNNQSSPQTSDDMGTACALCVLIALIGACGMISSRKFNTFH